MRNRAARVFKDVDRIDQMSQKEIFSIFDEEIEMMMNQVILNRKRSGERPNYIVNAFANLSTALWFYIYVDENVKVNTKKKEVRTSLKEDQIEALKWILAEAYRKSATNYFAKQADEFHDRDELISKAFVKLEPRLYELSKKLKLMKLKPRKNPKAPDPVTGISNVEKLVPDDEKTRELAIHLYNNPRSDFRFIHRIFNESEVSDKKKLKLLKEMYGDRFVRAVGAAFTVDNNNSDCLAMLYEYFEGLKKKSNKRADIIMAYAEAYKANRRTYYRLTREKFYKNNKKIIKALLAKDKSRSKQEKRDIGYKKAFSVLMHNVKNKANPVDTKKRSRNVESKKFMP